MSRLKLQKYPHFAPGYNVRGTIISIVKTNDGRWTFWCSPLKTDWVERNADLLSGTFPRLRDALDALEALIAVDPLPPEIMIRKPSPGTSFRRVRAGVYAVVHREGAAEYHGVLIRGKIPGLDWGWKLYNAHGRELCALPNLTSARREARGRLMSDAHDMTFVSWMFKEAATKADTPRKGEDC